MWGGLLKADEIRIVLAKNVEREIASMRPRVPSVRFFFVADIERDDPDHRGCVDIDDSVSRPRHRLIRCRSNANAIAMVMRSHDPIFPYNSDFHLS
jgi:hypothetical protein